MGKTIEQPVTWAELEKKGMKLSDGPSYISCRFGLWGKKVQRKKERVAAPSEVGQYTTGNIKRN